MNIKELNINVLKEYENNPRHNEAAVNKVAESIKEFGFKVPIIIDQNNVIITGHTRIKAARKLGLKKVPCIIADDLSPEQIKAFRLADNKVSEYATWDEDKLYTELMELKVVNFDIESFGFETKDIDISTADINSIVEKFENEKPNKVIEDNFDTEEAVEEITEPITKLGDVWLLGEHRLMCGDSTKIEDIEKLLDGNKIDMVFTDPPYNIDYKGINDNRKIKNDKMSDKDFISFLEKSIPKCDTAYVCCSWQYAYLFKKAMNNLGMNPKAMIVWDKINPAQHLDKYYKRHELIFYYGKFGGETTLRGDVWQLKRQRNTVHPTMKPIELIGMALEDNPDKRVVYDGFGGSGSTLIACEQLNRRCFTMELDPKYCDVIIKRWEQLTGGKAELINA